MGIEYVFGTEDRMNVKYSSFVNLVKEAVKGELIMNAVNCNVPHVYIREMATGETEEFIEERKYINEGDD